MYFLARPYLPSLPDTMHVDAYREHSTVLLWLERYDDALLALDLAEDAARRYGLTDRLDIVYRFKRDVTSHIQGRKFKGIRRGGAAPKWSVIAGFLGTLVFLLRRLRQRVDPQSREPSGEARS